MPRTVPPGGDVRYCRLSKSGGARTIAIPRELRDALGWQTHAPLEMWLEGDCLVIHHAVAVRDLLERDRATAPARDAGEKGGHE